MYIIINRNLMKEAFKKYVKASDSVRLDMLNISSVKVSIITNISVINASNYHST